MSEQPSSFKETWLYRRGRLWIVCLLVLFVAGLVFSPLQNRVWPAVKATQPELNLAQVEGALGQGVVIGILGGFRTLLADIVFLRANYFWERKDRAATEALVNLTTAIDPRPMFFWQNGSRIVAYDIPIWRIREAGDFEKISDEEADRIYAEQAERGMAVMRRAGQYHPQDYRVPLEIAQIYNNKLKDEAKAAEYYLKAWQMPGAPYYTARIYAELLRRIDRKQEAYTFLRNLYDQAVADNDPRASSQVILERIRDLEKELNISSLERLTQQPGEHFPQMHVNWDNVPSYGTRLPVVQQGIPFRNTDAEFVDEPPPAPAADSNAESDAEKSSTEATDATQATPAASSAPAAQ